MKRDVELERRIAFWCDCGIGADPPTYQHFATFAAALIKVRSRDNDGGTVPFVANEEQEQLLRHIIDEYFAGRPVRVIVLKARQIGITTALQVLEYWLCWLRRSFVALVMAHIAKSTANIAGMARGFSRTLPAFAKRACGADEVDGGLRWPGGSTMVVMTQGGNDGSRSFSPNFFHASELGRWDKNRAATTAEDAMVAALRSLGSGPWTIAVIESTADGAAGSMYDRWTAAESGESDWKPLFFSWLHSSLYPCPDESGDAELDARVRALLAAGERDAAKTALWEASSVWAPGDGRFVVPTALRAEWCERAVRLGIRAAQVRFAMREIYNTCNGDAAFFDQEMPVSADVAFASSGRRVWSDEEVKAHPVCAPLIVSGPLDKLPATGTLMERIAAASTPGDAVRIWELPAEGWVNRYAAGSDVGGGVGVDSTTCIIVDRVTGRQVAEFVSNKLAPDYAAVQAVRLCEIYSALLCWEANNHGVSFGGTIVNVLRYPNVWKRTPKVPSKSSDPSAWVNDYGYLTSEGSRQAMATRLVTALRTRTTAITSNRIAAEMRTWLNDEHGRPDHAAGKHDDALIGTALALYAGDQAGEAKRVVVEEDRPGYYRRNRPDRGVSQWAD